MGRSRLITREAAARTALEIIDCEGLDGFNLERIARALGVRPPSLYHHFAGKAEILVEVARVVFAEIDLKERNRDWQGYIVGVCLSFYDVVLRHPNAATLLIEALPDRIAAPTSARAAQVMTAAGVDRSLQQVLLTGTENITWGATVRKAMEIRRGTAIVPAAEIERRWPLLSQVRNSSRWADPDLLEASLHLFITGVISRAATDGGDDR